jgi:hypothetical protein
MYEKCPDSSDQLLNYLNNHNGGVLQTAVPTGTLNTQSKIIEIILKGKVTSSQRPKTWFNGK